MNDDESVIYKPSPKIRLISAFSFPIFFIFGEIFDNPLKPHYEIYPQIVIDLVISILLSIAFYWSYKWIFRLDEHYDRYKINWQRWEKSGKLAFILYRIVRFLPIVYSLLIAYTLFSFYVTNNNPSFFIFSLMTYICFSSGLIEGFGLWDIHQQKKAIGQA